MLSKKILINYILSAILFLAGFSQLKLGFFNPTQFLMIILLIVLIVQGYLKKNIIIYFVLFSILYAFLIGSLSKPILFLSEIFTYLLLFTLISFFKNFNETQINKYLRFFNLSMLLSNTVAILILLKIPSLRELVIDTSYIGFRFKGFFNQPNGYAFILLINVPIAIYIFIHKKNIFNLIAVLISLIALLLTQSRGAIIGIILSVILIYTIYAFQNNPLKRLRNIIFPSIAIATIIIIALIVLPQYLESNYGLNLTRINPLRENKSERKLTTFSMDDIQKDRFYLIKAGIETLSQRPWGLGYQDQHIIIGKTTGIYLIPHNYFLTLFLTYGLFLGIIWNCIIMYIIYRGFKYFIKHRITPQNIFFYLHFMMISVLLYYLTHSPEWTYFYIILAIYCSLIFNNSKTKPISQISLT